MKPARLIAILAIAAAPLAQAVLPPMAQSMKEIKTLMADHRLYELIGNEALITSVNRTNDGYLITTQPFCTVEVRKASPQETGKNLVGPERVEFTFPDGLPANCNFINK